MKSKRSYRVIRGLAYPVGEKDIEAAKRGRPVPRKEVAPGAVVSDIPACSVPWLLKSGAIEEVASGVQE